MARKNLGKYYTPDAVASALTAWAIRSSGDRILDPSFGGCAFFAAALKQFAVMGSRSGAKQLFGVDVDPDARRHLRALLSEQAENANFRIADFLGVEPSHFEHRMDAVVGNPPYVRHHLLTSAQLITARKGIGSDNTLSGKSGYWAYFVLHCLRFISKGGRLAMVLPGALLDADYAAPVRHALTSGFRNVRFALVRQRFFPDADEAGVLVLADGWGEHARVSTISVLDNVDQVPQWTQDERTVSHPVHLDNRWESWKSSLISSSARDALQVASMNPRVFRLGQLATIRIGTVTGANWFFILSRNEVRNAHLPTSALRYVIDSARRLTSLRLTLSDLRNLEEQGDRVWMLVPNSPLTRRTIEYLDGVAGLSARESSHCRRREPWYRITDIAVPDAFLTYVNSRAPRLVQNDARALCTNSVHRVWWRQELDARETQALGLGFLSSLSGLSAELSGRSYGGGVLKLEIHEAANTLIPQAIPRGASLINKVKDAHLAKKWESARELVDAEILGAGLGLPVKDITAMRDAQDFLFSLRMGTHKK